MAWTSKSRDNYWGGYQEYRHGDPKPVTLARTSIEKEQPIFTQKKRHHVVKEVMDSMRDWRLTRFEKEGPTRAGLRSALCLEGNPWPASDVEAARIVSEALSALGAQRPDYMEGQREHTIAREDCAWCMREIEADSWGRRSRFCSAECAQFALVHRQAGEDSRDEKWRTSASRLIHREKLPPLTCAYCATAFKSADRKARYCSPACAGKAGNGHLLDKSCAWCSKQFHPQRDTIMCCSRICGAAYRGKLFREANPERECEQCNEVFAPSAPHVVYCSATCKRRASYRRGKERELWSAEIIMLQSPVLTAEIFDTWFKVAA